MAETYIVETSIRQSIMKNGFPEKIVRLPFRPVYQSCKAHGTSLTTVLKNLEKEKVFGKIAGNHIEFRSEKMLHHHSEKTPEANPAVDFMGTPGTAQGNLMETARRYMENMTPEQKAEIQKKVDTMSDEEKKNILQMLSQQFKPN